MTGRMTGRMDGKDNHRKRTKPRILYKKIYVGDFCNCNLEIKNVIVNIFTITIGKNKEIQWEDLCRLKIQHNNLIFHSLK